MSLTYLACPYSHPDRNVRVARFIAANRAASGNERLARPRRSEVAIAGNGPVSLATARNLRPYGNHAQQNFTLALIARIVPEPFWTATSDRLRIQTNRRPNAFRSN